MELGQFGHGKPADGLDRLNIVIPQVQYLNVGKYPRPAIKTNSSNSTHSITSSNSTHSIASSNSISNMSTNTTTTTMVNRCDCLMLYNLSQYLWVLV